MDATIAAAFAAATPAYVRASSTAWEVVDSATGEVRAERTGLREALEIATKGLADKPPMLRSANGEPDGTWRYLPAASEEATPNEQDGVRLSERNIWQLASGLNAKTQAAPIDGGPGSVVHGTAHDSATLANGWAHHGIVVYDASSTAGLYLHSEIVPSVATMIDRGQLAYGSIHFFTSEPLDDSGAPEEAGLISYALTNTPADQRITPASAVRSRQVVRTRQLQRAAPLSIGDRVYVDPSKAHMPEASGSGTVEIIAGPALGIRFDVAPDEVHRWYVAEELSAPTERSMEDMAHSKKDWQAALDAIAAKDGITIEQLCQVAMGLAAQKGAPDAQDAAPAEGDQMQAAPPAEQRNGDISESDIPDKIKKLISEGKDPKQAAAIAYRMAREALGLRAIAGLEDPAALETFAATVIDELRKILGKPDADPASLLSELQAMRDKLAAAANAAPPAQDGTPADQQGANAMSAEGRAKRTESVTRARDALGRKDGDDIDELVRELSDRLDRHGHEKWADAEISARKLVVNADAREALIDIASAGGRDKATKFLAGLSAPPSGQLMRQSLNGNQGAAPTTLSQAVDACVADAKAILDEEAKKANRASLSGDPSLTRARAQHIARERYPHFFQPNDAA